MKVASLCGEFEVEFTTWLGELLVGNVVVNIKWDLDRNPKTHRLCLVQVYFSGY